MKILLLMCSILSTSLFAQEKYIMLKPLTWDELQLYQLDNLKTVNELKLASVCPSTLKKLQSSFEKIGTHFQHILGTNYTWTEYANTKGLKCIVKHEKIDSITQQDDKTINPNSYKLLDIIQARVLISASLGVGIKEKDISKKMMEANRINQKIQAIPYEKYGGLENLMKYMEENKPSYPIEYRHLKNRNYKTTLGSNGAKLLPPYKLFELTYSQEQRSKLIEIVKKKKTINPLKATDTKSATMVLVPDSKIFNTDNLPSSLMVELE